MLSEIDELCNCAKIDTLYEVGPIRRARPVFEDNFASSVQLFVVSKGHRALGKSWIRRKVK